MLYDISNDKRTLYDKWNLGSLLQVNPKHEAAFIKAGGLTLLPTYSLSLSRLVKVQRMGRLWL